MKKSLYVVSRGVLATLIAATMITPGFAADKDIYDLSDLSAPKYTQNQVVNNFKWQNEITLNSNKFGYELGGNVYNFNDVNEVYNEEGKNLTKMLKELPNKKTPAGKVGEVVTEVKVEKTLAEVKEFIGGTYAVTVEFKVEGTTKVPASVTVNGTAINSKSANNGVYRYEGVVKGEPKEAIVTIGGKTYTVGLEQAVTEVKVEKTLAEVKEFIGGTYAVTVEFKVEGTTKVPASVTVNGTAINSKSANNGVYRYEGVVKGEPKEAIVTIDGKTHTIQLDASIKPEKPAAPKVTANDEENTISGLDITMEYKIDDGDWTRYSEGAVLDLTGNKTVLVRVAAAGETPAGDESKLVFTEETASEVKVNKTANTDKKVFVPGTYAVFVEFKVEGTTEVPTSVTVNGQEMSPATAEDGAYAYEGVVDGNPTEALITIGGTTYTIQF